MHITCNVIREHARTNLKGKWTLTAICTFLCGNLIALMEFIPKELHLRRFSIILAFVSISLFIFGYNDIILQITRGNNIKFLKFFSGCKRALKGFRMVILIKVYIFLWSILLVIPGIIASIKYSMVYFIWVDNPNIGITEAIEKSVDITYGYKKEIFKLILSFIVWLLLLFALFLGIEFISNYYIDSSNWLIQNCSKIILLIGFLYLETYINVSMGVLYNKLVEFR